MYLGFKVTLKVKKNYNTLIYREKNLIHHGTYGAIGVIFFLRIGLLLFVQGPVIRQVLDGHIFRDGLLSVLIEVVSQAPFLGKISFEPPEDL